jgi:hypothetical protein
VSSPAKLPLEARDPAERRIASLQPGESAFTFFNCLLVTSDGECFLHPYGRLKSEDGAVMIGVRRDAEGFHVTLPPDRKYTPGEGLSAIEESIPVASMTIRETEEQ